MTVFTDDLAPIAEQLEEFGVRVTEKDVYIPEPIDSNCHLVIAVDQFNNPTLVKNSIDSIKAGGCLLFVESKKPTEQQINSTGLELVANLKSQDNKSFVLLRKVNNNIICTTRLNKRKSNCLFDCRPLAYPRRSWLTVPEKILPGLKHSNQHSSSLNKKTSKYF